MTKYYTGIGARSTPRDVCLLMNRLAQYLERRDWTLRSGGAEGADLAFEEPILRLKQIFYANQATDEAMDLAARYHPKWQSLDKYARRLHGRNVFQVLGPDLQTPSRFVVCWTRDGAVSGHERSHNTGGTGTAISIAGAHDIPVFNLRRDDHRARVEARLCSS